MIIYSTTHERLLSSTKEALKAPFDFNEKHRIDPSGIGSDPRDPSGGKNSELEKNSELATRDRGEIGRSTVGFEAFIAVRRAWVSSRGA